MIIDYKQKKDGLDISYVNDKKQIDVVELILEDGFYTYSACDEYDPNMIPGFKSFKGSYIKREPAKFFSHHNINEFFAKDISKNHPEIFEKTSKLIEPIPFSLDIEVLPTDEFGYSPPDEAKNPITAISITDFNLNSILFMVKNENHPVINDFDKEYINVILKDSLKHHYSAYEYKNDVRFFDTEVEMLKVFIECINNHFHLSIGWNFLGYDWQYIYNRCTNVGIDVKKASPKRGLSKKSIKINKETSIDLQIPTHRIIVDYMSLFQESLIYNNLGSYSLDSISEMVLEINKVSYEGNLRTLYREDFRKFIAYTFIDSILTMLIHRKTNLLSVDFFQSYYTGVPYLRISQNSISEALVYQELMLDNQFLLESEKNIAIKRKYKGGYVKTPIVKLVESCMGEDYGGLYPNSMITSGVSPEAKIDSLVVDDEGHPINEVEMTKWLKYKSMGYSLSPMGRIYDVTKDYLYTRIEKKLLAQRKVFKGHAEDLYLNVIPMLEKELQKRKVAELQ